MSQSNTRAYLFKFRGSDYVFCKTAGHGAECQAQIVQKVSTGELLIRKVSKHRLDYMKCSDPHEFRIVQDYLSKPPLVPGLVPLIPKLYGHEKLPAKGEKFHLVSYWQLLNGGALKDLILTKFNSLKHSRYDPNVRIPARLIVRMIHQVFSSLQHMYTVNPDTPIFHRDLHANNVWMHLPTTSNGELSAIPDFYLGDFGYAGWPYGFTTNHWATRDIEQVMFFAHLMISANLPEAYRPPKDMKVPNPNIPNRGNIPNDAPMTAVLRMYYSFCEEINSWKLENSRFFRKASCPPPDLMGMIRKAEALEKQLSPSLTGTLTMNMSGMDESKDPRVVQFYNEMKGRALMKVSAQPLTMTGTVQTCLTPMVGTNPVKVHGPFYLAEKRFGKWEAIDNQTYHRPGKTRGSGRGLRALSDSPDEDGESDSEPE
ncbi:hypothetical protein B0T20DRAFT_377123, partial [Sordaria brevicollis]